MEENVFEKKLYNILEQNISIPKSITNSILTFDCKKKTGRNMQSLKKIAVAFSFLVISISFVVYAFTTKQDYKAATSIGFVNDSLKKAVESGYIQNVNMEYAYSNKIGAKIDYIVMSDYNLNILFNFDISQTKNITELAEIQDLLIYDENNNIIFCYNKNIYKEFCKKNKLKCIDDFFHQQYANGYGIQSIELDEKNNKSLYTIRTTKGFPKSKRLYIQFKTICFNREQITKIKGNWNLEVNLSEQFYNRYTIKYELKGQSNDIELINAKSTATTTRITYKMKNIDISKIRNISMYLEDMSGNRYDVNTIEDSVYVYKDEISATFPITSNDDIEQLKLYIVLDNVYNSSIILTKEKGN